MDFVDAVVRCLDPADPQLRRRSLGASTCALFALVKTFPTAAFHQVSQKIAVAAPGGMVVAYDLRTAVRFRVFEGSGGALAASMD